MEIAFAIRSRFLEACENAIRKGRAELDANQAVRVELAEGGYVGRVVVTIRPENAAHFMSDWEQGDETRFPARIKAAATALLRCGCIGDFEVVHTNGLLEIRRSEMPNKSDDAADGSRTVHLVSCVGLKRSEPSAAKDLYVSDWFKKARMYVEAAGGRWFILSAEHGLVEPDTKIAPYEKTLNTMPIGERREWAMKVRTQMDEGLPDLSRAVFLAGQRYREFLIGYFEERKIEVVIPMAGLKIGEQLSWLAKHLPPPVD